MSFHSLLLSFCNFDLYLTVVHLLMFTCFSPQIPNYGLALAVAQEWAATKDKITPSLMHLVSHVGRTWCIDALLKEIVVYVSTEDNKFINFLFHRQALPTL